MWNIDEDLKEITDIYFRSCMEDKARNELVKQFSKLDVPALHVPELDKWFLLIQGKQSLASLCWEQDLQVAERNICSWSTLHPSPAFEKGPTPFKSVRQSTWFSKAFACSDMLWLLSTSIDARNSSNSSPLAEQFDSRVQPWREEKAYAFPPFNLISECLRKIGLKGATLLIICPVWPAQARYPHLLQLLTDNPVLLPSLNDLLLNPMGDRHPMITNNSLPLAGWRVSGITSRQKAYREKLQIFSSLPNADQQMFSTSPVGLSGVAGVVNDKLTPFVQL